MSASTHPENDARINLGECEDFELGGLRVCPAAREASRDGQRHELEPKVVQVLVALASARPKVVSRDRLIEQCWDGRIVGDDALNRCIVALRHLAKEFSPPPFAIETVPRVGYRLVEHESRGVAARVRRLKPGSWRPAAAIAAILLALAGSLIFWQQRALSAKPASIAVLPFRNLSNGNPHFAEGIGEEILAQLTREPAFRVAGRNVAAQFRESADPGEVRKALGVDYLLEGSVRSQDDRVRVIATLVRTSDGTRLWSETYDRGVGDILAIQNAIGEGVARELSRKLVRTRSDKPSVNPKAYAAYLHGRGLVRSQNPDSGAEAVGLLKEAVRAEPGFAPAWSSLAEALHLHGRTKDSEGMIAILPEARGAARRAVRIDPDLAEAHVILAMLLGDDSREGVAHLRRAVALDPRGPEGLWWLGIAHHLTGRYRETLEVKRRAHALDPAWPQVVRALADLSAELGDRKAAEAIVRRGFPDDPMTQHFGLGRMAWFVGDLSEAARRWAIVANTSTRFARPARGSLHDVRFILRLDDQPPAQPGRPFLGHNRFGKRVWMTSPPAPSEWRWRNRSSAAALVYSDLNIVAAKLMLRSGRARELVATYDRPTGLLGVFRGEPLIACQLHETPLVALALREVGRGEEANELLRKAEATIRDVYRQGTVPTWFEDDAAAVWAVQGKSDLAISALERALQRGWVHAGSTDLPRLEDEPAFASLRGHPRFERLLARYHAHYAKERAETAKVLGAIAWGPTEAG